MLPSLTGDPTFRQSFVAILRNAFSANPAAMVISGTAISVLVFNNEYLKVSSERGGSRYHGGERSAAA